MDLYLFLIFFYSLITEKKMEVGQVKEVKGTRVLFRAVLLKVGCDDL